VTAVTVFHPTCAVCFKLCWLKCVLLLSTYSANITCLDTLRIIMVYCSIYISWLCQLSSCFQATLGLCCVQLRTRRLAYICCSRVRQDLWIWLKVKVRSKLKADNLLHIGHQFAAHWDRHNFELSWQWWSLEAWSRSRVPFLRVSVSKASGLVSVSMATGLESLKIAMKWYSNFFIIQRFFICCYWR